jgi:hypothetical protein
VHVEVTRNTLFVRATSIATTHGPSLSFGHDGRGFRATWAR